MKNNIEQKYKSLISNIKFKVWWLILPLSSAAFVILTLPPFNLWIFGFIALSPIYIFIRLAQSYSWQKTALGGFFFGFFFTAFILGLTVLQFHWIEETHLFTSIVKLSSIFILIGMGIFSSVVILISRSIHTESAISFLLFEASLWTLSEWIIRKMMFGIEYSIIGYPARNTIFVSLARYGGVYLTVFFVSLISMGIGSICYYSYLGWLKKTSSDNEAKRQIRKNVYSSIGLVVGTALIGYTIFAYTTHATYTRSKAQINDMATLNDAAHVEKKSEGHLDLSDDKVHRINIAFIQNQDRKGDPFGKEEILPVSFTDPNTGEVRVSKKNVFTFPALENEVAIAQRLREKNNQRTDNQSPLIIIYPFAPWIGSIAEKQDRNIFDKNVIATDFDTFKEWTKKYIEPGNIFVTWNTTYRKNNTGGNFYNEIIFWKDGEVIGYNQKNILFPFLDYTPKLSSKLGLFTTPVDAISGTSTLSIPIGGVQVGALVCSEIAHSIYKTTSHNKDIILAIGSEAFFPTSIAGEMNLTNAVYRAVESGIPVVRSNRFGPSAVIDKNGKIENYIAHGEDGVLLSSIDIETKTNSTPYEKGGEKVLIVGLLVLVGYIYLKSKNFKLRPF